MVCSTDILLALIGPIGTPGPNAVSARLFSNLYSCDIAASDLNDAATTSKSKLGRK